jgi:hypothetical protein
MFKAKDLGFRLNELRVQRKKYRLTRFPQAGVGPVKAVRKVAPRECKERKEGISSFELRVESNPECDQERITESREEKREHRGWGGRID